MKQVENSNLKELNQYKKTVRISLEILKFIIYFIFLFVMAGIIGFVIKLLFSLENDNVIVMQLLLAFIIAFTLLAIAYICCCKLTVELMESEKMDTCPSKRKVSTK